MPTAPELSVRRVMNADPVRVGPDTHIQEVLDRMNHRRIGAVLVEDAGTLVGIFTERDFLRRAAGATPGWRELPVRDWMTTDPYTIGPDASWETAAAEMERLRVRHLPVVEDGRIVGIISARGLIGHRADHLNRVVEERTYELRRANDQLLARDAEMMHYMKVAGRLQARMVLPQSPPDWPEVGWGVHFAPLDPLGGDYYDFARPEPDRLGILIADASGHSIPAALVAIMARQAFREASGRAKEPGAVLGEMNARLQDLTEERFVTAFYGVLDRRTRRFTYANAGHPFPLRFVAQERRCQPLSARGFMLGVMPEEVYTEQTIELEPGDRLCFFTDGVPDCRDERGEAFGTDRLEEYLRMHGHSPVTRLTDGLVGHLASFRGDAVACDDMTLLLAEMRG